MPRPSRLAALLGLLAIASLTAGPALAQSPVPYRLSKEEQALDCKKLTGRMQVRILQIRDFNQHSPQTSIGSRLMQQAVTPIFGGTTIGASPSADHARDRAMLEAYNRRLAEKQCKTFDLDKELKPQPIQSTPRPIETKKN